MQFSDRELRQIVAQASTLSERLQGDVLPNVQNGYDEHVEKRIARWCQVVADDDPEKFQTRLRWEGLSKDDLEPLLGAVVFPLERSLPWWADAINICMQEIRVFASNIKSCGGYRFCSVEEPVPYEDVFVPFILFARKQLVERAGSLFDDCFTDQAQGQLERYLLQQLANVCAQTFHLEFSILRASRRSAFSMLLAQQHASSEVENSLYMEFVKELFGGKLKTILFEYPVLCRLIPIIIENWITAVSEFLQHLQTDWEKIQQTFQPNSPLGQVAFARAGLSDPHNNNKTVISLQFTTGLQLIYKPRNLNVAQSFYQLLDWFNDHTDIPPFKTIKILNEGSHGWVEYISYLPCQDHNMLARYYTRTGMYLCLFYLLDATDCHLENVIAHGEYPVFIDTETLFHPHFTYPKEEEDNSRSLAEIILNRSVLRTDFLPRWHWGENREGYDVSGIGGMAEPDKRIASMKWQEINTDKMNLKQLLVPIKSSQNLPSLNGSSITAENYVQQIVAGFEKMYFLALDNRNLLLAANGPISPFKSQRVRIIFRNTKVYNGLLNNSLHPKRLRAGIDRSIEIDILSRAYLGTEESPVYWPLLQTERMAIEALDVPLIMGDINHDVLVSSFNEPIHNYLLEPSYESVKKRILQLNQNELAAQMDLIAVSLDVRFSVKRNLTNKNLDVAHPDIDELYSNDKLVQQAINIADMLQGHMILSRNDAMVSWIGLKYVPEAACSQLVPLRDNLHSGALGVALFLAAVAKVTDREDLKIVSRKALQPLCRRLEGQNKLDRIGLAQTGIGGVMGFGSMVYAVTKIGQLLDAPELLEFAKEVSTRITDDLIHNDSHFDVMDGSAGALLGLLSLHEQSGEAAILQKAIACGEHLLQNRIVVQPGQNGWPSVISKPIAGFSHGAAGNAYALLRLFAATQELRFKDAAQAAIAYENSLFCLQAQNWQYLLQKDSDEPIFRTAWCHGAPGIGLARLGGLDIFDSLDVRHDIEAALQTTKHVGLTELDNLCCGNMGRAELFVVAAEKLSQPELLDVARVQATAVLKREKRSGSFFLPHRPPGPKQNLFQWGFFHGVSGIGYQLLRIAFSKQLPSVLLWQ